ncbi:MAG: diaminopimelate decarboxylase [Chloroflexi bacterium]|nr:diaminopimelate decarboxylase [Chloroflexota bacterium]
MNTFHYINKKLFCDQIPLEKLASEFGTPLYIYSTKRLRENVNRLQTAFDALNPQICYAVKANDNLALLQLFHKLGLGFDVVSGGELHRAIQAGANPEQIAFAGVGKTDAELKLALHSDISKISVESAEELDVLNRIAGELNCRPSVLLRLNPNIAPKTHHHIVTGNAESKFGIAIDLARELRAQNWDNLNLRGVHIHIGSQIPDPTPVLAAMDVVLDFLEECPPNWDIFDLGGGFPVAYRPELVPSSFANFAQIAANRLARFPRPLKLILEPGRSLIADSSALLLTVQISKQTGTHRTIVVDGGMNTLLRPALYDAYHHVLPFHEKNKKTYPTHIAGPICESADYLARDRHLPDMSRNDRIALLTTGAYGYSMASHYNAHPRPAEVLVDGDSYHLIRRRETYTDLDSRDIIP